MDVVAKISGTFVLGTGAVPGSTSVRLLRWVGGGRRPGRGAVFGWAECLGSHPPDRKLPPSGFRIHVCSQSPCLADYHPSKHGDLPPPLVDLAVHYVAPPPGPPPLPPPPTDPPPCDDVPANSADCAAAAASAVHPAERSAVPDVATVAAADVAGSAAVAALFWSSVASSSAAPAAAVVAVAADVAAASEHLTSDASVNGAAAMLARADAVGRPEQTLGCWSSLPFVQPASGD